MDWIFQSFKRVTRVGTSIVHILVYFYTDRVFSSVY